MNYRPNTRLIGTFIAVALVAIMAMVAFFGSTSLFAQRSRFLLLFDQSINGLTVGSPVKFRGVPIGSVERIMIRFEGQSSDSNAIPVVIQIDHDRLEDEFGVEVDVFSEQAMQEEVERGLAAQLNLESFITGQLFVELSYVDDDVETYRTTLAEDVELGLIPTVTSSMDEITNDIARLVAEAGAIDMARLNENVNRTLENMADLLAGVDADGMSEAVISAANRVDGFFASEAFNDLVAALGEAVDQARATMASLDMEEGPLAPAVARNAQRMEGVLQNLETLTASADSLIAPGADMRFELETAIRELGRAARSLRELSDFIERNPRAFLTGLAEEENQP